LDGRITYLFFYWFNSRERVTIPVGAGIALTNTNDNLAVITLTSGWNQIGNPYAFTISWSDVLATNGITDEVESNLRLFAGGTALKYHYLKCLWRSLRTGQSRNTAGIRRSRRQN